MKSKDKRTPKIDGSHVNVVTEKNMKFGKVFMPAKKEYNNKVLKGKNDCNSEFSLRKRKANISFHSWTFYFMMNILNIIYSL